ncbi:uncharacterized protein [Apostichopus japonicus]|uniref:uncharacterized protein isoform X1 n=1 Tax=Stichopus japonicus TaxID=307972 RepID=UPI003AB7A45E
MTTRRISFVVDVVVLCFCELLNPPFERSLPSDRESLVVGNRRTRNVMEQTLKQQEEEVEILIEQECQLNKLRSNLEDVNTISIGLAELIRNQSSGIDNIEASVENACSDVGQANDHLSEAVRHKNAARRKKCCAVIICMLFIIVLVGAIVLYFLFN